MTHICVGNLTIIGPDNGLSPGRRQAIIWTSAGTLLIGPWGTSFTEILIGIQAFSFRKMHLKMSSAKWCPIRLGLNVSIASLPHGLDCDDTWGLHDMEALFPLLALCEGNHPVTGALPSRKTSNKELWGFYLLSAWQFVELTVELPVIWDAMTIMSHHRYTVTVHGWKRPICHFWGTLLFTRGFVTSQTCTCLFLIHDVHFI